MNSCCLGRRWLAFILIILALGCSREEQSGGQAYQPGHSYELPDPEVLARSRALADSGYVLMALERHDEAIALMKASHEALPSSPWGPYNLACAYSQAGDRSAALALLESAIEAGWDKYHHMLHDPDLEPLREDPGLAGLIERAKENFARGLQPLARGLPEVQVTETFSSLDSLWMYYQEQRRDLYRRSSSLCDWQQQLAEMELNAKRILARARMHPPDSTLVEGLERIRALGTALGMWRAWGPVADGTIHEVERFLATDPEAGYRDEALFFAGQAAFCRTFPEPTDPDWDDAVREARQWFDKIAPGSRFEGAVAAWDVAFALKVAGETTGALRDRLLEFGATHGSDHRALYVAHTFFMDELIKAEWPIPFAAKDMEGRSVTLDDYRGRLLLLCYWTTW